LKTTQVRGIKFLPWTYYTKTHYFYHMGIFRKFKISFNRANFFESMLEM